MQLTSRRNFLKTTAAATACLDAFKSSLLWAAPVGSVQAWTTSKDRRFESIEGPQLLRATANSSGTSQIDTAVRY